MTKPLKSMTLEGWEGLSEIKPQFFTLFQRAFGREYPALLWDHYYKNNPCGPTLAVCLWDQDRLAGFTGLLMQELVDHKTTSLIPFGYPVTVMIDPDYRRGGAAYFQLMNQIKKIGAKAGLRFLVSFPNADHFLTMTRLVNFKLIDSARFVRSRGGLGRYATFLTQELEKVFFSDRLWKWRLSRFPYQREKGCITKMFRGEKNILDWLEVGESPDPAEIFPFWFSSGECPDNFEPVDHYMIRFCCYSIDTQFDPQTIKKSILYSDVY